MATWLIFCSICIMVVCSALIREGFGVPLAAKVAGWSMLAAMFSALVPSAIAQLEAYRRIPGTGASELNSWASSQQSFNWKPVKTLKILPDQPHDAPQTVTSAENKVEQGIDFTTICGGGERYLGNRRDIAESGKKPDDRQC
jgi:hypothetical protein